MNPTQNRFFFSILRLRAARPAMPDDASVRNVICELSDDHRYDFVGFHPSAPKWLETPAMDRIAKEGVHVANAFVSPFCSHPALLTYQPDLPQD